ncbi:hypothetical protein EV421DRAFT_1734563 [Armillaria borealis]|uniref:Uncharacterized protein n=1 Tax=Armillaria borealis TaxID=47425 RepID=A0AA39JSW0_9AGAR|nr:hypothetical protein EV421DRAFT_1734563 [Armillaria borealis]
MFSQPSVALPSIGETFGACYIGSLIAAMVLDALHVAFSTHALYYYMITMFGNFNGGLGRILWLYAIRIWKAFYLGTTIFQTSLSKKFTDAAYEIHLLPNLLSLAVIPDGNNVLLHGVLSSSPDATDSDIKLSN